MWDIQSLLKHYRRNPSGPDFEVYRLIGLYEHAHPASRAADVLADAEFIQAWPCTSRPHRRRHVRDIKTNELFCVLVDDIMEIPTKCTDEAGTASSEPDFDETRGDF